MKRMLSALLALTVCASAAVAEGQLPANPEVEVAPEPGAKRAEDAANEIAAAGGASEAKELPEGEARPAAESAAEEKKEKQNSEAAGETPGGADIDPDKSDATGEASADPTPDASEASGATGAEDAEGGEQPPEANASAAPGEAEVSPDPEATPDPDAPQASPSPSESPEASVSPEPSASPSAEPEGPEGYILADGERQSGTLAELLAAPGKKTVYLLTKQPVVIPEFRLALLQDVTLLPDPETFPGEKYAVRLTDGAAEITPEAIAAATDEIVALNICVEEIPPEPEDTPKPGAVQLRVTAQNYTAGSWMNWSPEFLLSGIPEGERGYSYVAVIYDERFIPLSGDFYIPTEEGVYTLRFAILDPQGDVADSSEPYELMLDLTPPELEIAVSDKSDFTMSLSATDAPGGEAEIASGVAEFSLDGGASWSPLGEGESVVHSEARKKSFPPQTILARDLAGNVSGNEEEIVLAKLPDFSLGGFGGGGGASSTPKPQHASGSGDDAPYAAYELSLPDGAVDVLTLGGEEIDLGLAVDGEDSAAFTAKLTAWARESAEAEPAKDTLVVRAQAGGEGGDARTYAWRVNGSVLRKLYNSDISYLALAAGDAVLSLPTVGFTAGTRYAELKMSGVSTSEFEYEITMRTGEEHPVATWNLSRDCAVELAVEVAGERFEMVDRSTTPEMYPYDVYCGPEDLPDYPYGAYPGMEMED